MTEEVNGQIAEVAYGTIRALGESLGEVDIPTWQIARSDVKASYLWAVRWVAERPAATVGEMGRAHQERFPKRHPDPNEKRFRLLKAVVLAMVA